MLGTYYYHEILRRTVIAFGTLFNDINVRHTGNNGENLSQIKVPVSYGPRQKFLARIQLQPDLNKATTLSLPRMSFEMTNIQYDSTRKSGITQTFKASDGALQIVEQILPFFQPAFNLTVDLVSSIGEKRDIPMVLDSISFQDDYEGDFATRRALIYTLSFTAKTYLFGPIAETTEGLIKKVQIDTYMNTDTTVANREMRYTVTPDPITAGPDDAFGFDEQYEFFGDAKEYSPTRQTDI